jgi:hypothetical protein
MNLNGFASMSAVAVAVVASVMPAQLLGDAGFSNLTHLSQSNRTFLPLGSTTPTNLTWESEALGAIVSPPFNSLQRGFASAFWISGNVQASRLNDFNDQPRILAERSVMNARFDVIGQTIDVELFANLLEGTVYTDFRFERIADGSGTLLQQPQSVANVTWRYGFSNSPTPEDPLGIIANGFISIPQLTLTPGSYRILAEVDVSRNPVRTATLPFGPNSTGGGIVSFQLGVIPTPGAAGLFAGGMLMALRRRR